MLTEPRGEIAAAYAQKCLKHVNIYARFSLLKFLICLLFIIPNIITGFMGKLNVWKCFEICMCNFESINVLITTEE